MILGWKLFVVLSRNSDSEVVGGTCLIQPDTIPSWLPHQFTRHATAGVEGLQIFEIIFKKSINETNTN